jgi:DNA modification methylase
MYKLERLIDIYGQEYDQLYWEVGEVEWLNKIILGDCLNVMGQFPDKSFDMILCDLPYGTTRSRWDKIIPFEPLWLHYERIIKDNGAIVLFAKSPFDKLLAASNMDLYRYEWIWEKNKATGHLNANKMPMQAHENILVFYKHEPTYNPQMTYGHKPMNFAINNHKSTVYGDGHGVANKAGSTDRYPRSVLHFPVINNDDSERIHPNQKPVESCEYFIRTYTNEGETVLDNCIGSGTTAEACMNTGRNFVGIESDEEVYQKALKRLSSVQAVMNL